MCSMETAAEEKWQDVKELDTATTGTKIIMANLPFIPILKCQSVILWLSFVVDNLIYRLSII